MFFFKRKNMEFYTDSLEFMLRLKETLNDCLRVLEKSTLNDYSERFKSCADAMDGMIDTIDKFTENWNSDKDKVYDTIQVGKDYIKYYARLCKASTDGNFKHNATYMVDSINTLTLVLDSKIKVLREKIVD